MDENKSLWNKTAAEVTVKDQLIIAVIVPAIMVGGLMAAGAASSVARKVSSKFRKTEIETTETTEETN